mmetsp:Transcript_20271/g.24221  ORF Transcript_20271/g.24221 Transcript_20271/m.24221 type:complete len:229 (+) Transcript_20271:243-929(+)|eukprot:CAMPEP_0197858340 /NCGR_PEP_ID=MMETSP1438-20131217/32082_1 /TAXON_ID=1461541 /ORGANISM="Pterosperma sp., Strain CCMP1384" /LENGTH=228 /DNA_ID=CAMNT_0043474475 /DNA_START=239 /DNA_END=925 /DNA_ORIENTATION=-
MKLGYWKIRGLAGPIRLLLEHVGESYEEEIYEQGDADSGYCKKVWFDVKDKLGLPLPNLPYLIDGSVQITQSTAILRYLAKKHNLLGETEQEQCDADMVVGEGMDLNGRFTGLCYRGDPFEEKKDAYLKELPQYLHRFSEFLASKSFFAGEKVTYCDFVMWHQLDQHKMLDPQCLDPFPNLAEFISRFEALPNIKAYMLGDKFIYYPINNKHAKFGGDAPRQHAGLEP